MDPKSICKSIDVLFVYLCSGTHNQNDDKNLCGLIQLVSLFGSLSNSTLFFSHMADIVCLFCFDVKKSCYWIVWNNLLQKCSRKEETVWMIEYLKLFGCDCDTLDIVQSWLDAIV